MTLLCSVLGQTIKVVYSPSLLYYELLVVLIFNSSTPSNNIACLCMTPDIIINYCKMRHSNLVGRIQVVTNKQEDEVRKMFYIDVSIVLICKQVASA